MTIEHFPPSPQLAPYIREFLLIESAGNVDNKPLPDTHLVMTFRYSGLVQADNKDHLAPVSLSGLRKSARQFTYHKDTGNLLVIFKEGGLRAFRFQPVPAHALFNQHLSCENLVPASLLEALLDQLANAGTARQRITLAENFLLRHLQEHVEDVLVRHAIERIKSQRGLVKMKSLALSLHISQDAFEKRFRALVGATPKQFASIVRLRHLIATYPTASSLTDACYEAGYFDQSHFIKDFRAFTGETPRQFFASQRSW